MIVAHAELILRVVGGGAFGGVIGYERDSGVVPRDRAPRACKHAERRYAPGPIPCQRLKAFWNAGPLS